MTKVFIDPMTGLVAVRRHGNCSTRAIFIFK